MINKGESLSLTTREPKLFYGYIIVLASFFAIAVMWGTMYSYGVFFEPMLTEFGWARATASAAYSFCLFFGDVLSIATGKLTDRFGPRLVITGCGLFFGLGYILMSQITVIWQLYLLYGAIIGAGMSGSFIPLVSTIARWFVKRRGTMTGIAMAGGGMGVMIIPPMVRWLISNYGWRISYIIVGIIILVLLILLAQFLKRDPTQIGQLSYRGKESKESSLNLGAGGFSLRQAIHTRQFWLLCLIFAAILFSISGVVVHIAIHATGLGISATSAANIFIFIGGGSIIGRIVMGIAGDKLGNKSAMIVGFILMSAALFWLLVAKEIWILYLFGAIFGFANHGLMVLMSPMAAELFGLTSHGMIFGVIHTGGAIGEGSGPVVVGRIYDITGSYRLGFLVSATIGVIGILATLLLRPTSHKGGNKYD
ncbi:MFS transporter [Chloroflexota bacterium]